MIIKMMIKRLSSPWRILMVLNPLDLWREERVGKLSHAIIGRDRCLVVITSLFLTIVIGRIAVMFIIMVKEDMIAILNTNPPYLWTLLVLMRRTILLYWIMKSLLILDISTKAIHILCINLLRYLSWKDLVFMLALKLCITNETKVEIHFLFLLSMFHFPSLFTNQSHFIY